ncbi:MAG: hypothetical protein ACTHW7_14805 [Actinomycetaceae bacterium]
MSTGTEDLSVATAPATTLPPRRQHPPVSYSPADRFMRALLRVAPETGSDAGAHRRLRVSLFVSAVRCIITYVLIPVLVPILSIAQVLAAPVGIALCALAVVTGITSLRRFWALNHRSRWMYTAFVAVVFVTLAFALYSDISRLATA